MARAFLTAIAAALVCPGLAQAGLPNLINISSDQLHAVGDTFGAALLFRPLEPASNYGNAGRGISGKKFGLTIGFELGEVSGIAMKAFYGSSSGSTVGIIPAAGLVLGAGIPFGLGAEIGFLPWFAANGFSFWDYAFNGKWTFTDLLWSGSHLFDAALRVGAQTAGLGFSQTGGPVTNIGFTSGTTQTGILASKKFGGFAEIYSGLALVRESSTLSTAVGTTIFNQSVSLSNEASVSATHMLYYLGFQLKFLLPTFSFEYSDVGGINGFALKLALKY